MRAAYMVTMETFFLKPNTCSILMKNITAIQSSVIINKLILYKKQLSDPTCQLSENPFVPRLLFLSFWFTFCNILTSIIQTGFQYVICLSLRLMTYFRTDERSGHTCEVLHIFIQNIFK